MNACTRRSVNFVLLLLLASTGAGGAAIAATPQVRVTRVSASPIVIESMLTAADGASINGPTLIRVPAWVQKPLGKYYLYFAHHAGKYIRLAYADHLDGPWKIHEGGVQPLAAQTALSGHIASPEAVVDETTRRIFLFYHGGNPDKKKDPADGGDPEAGQLTSASVSTDGVEFKPLNRIVGPAYLRVFHYRGEWYALNHSGVLRRARILGEPFEPVAKIIGDDISAAVDPARLGEPGAAAAENRPANGPFRYTIRHVGVDVDGDRLTVFFSCVGHRPERILCTLVDLKGPAESWKARHAIEVVRPETESEGANLPLAFSRGGISRTRVNELRDPAVFRENGIAWLIYSVAGEHGLGLAQVQFETKQ